MLILGGKRVLLMQCDKLMEYSFFVKRSSVYASYRTAWFVVLEQLSPQLGLWCLNNLAHSEIGAKQLHPHKSTILQGHRRGFKFVKIHGVQDVIPYYSVLLPDS